MAAARACLSKATAAMSICGDSKKYVRQAADSLSGASRVVQLRSRRQAANSLSDYARMSEGKDGKSVARRPLWLTPDVERAWLYASGDFDAGVGHRREHGHF